MNPWRRVCGPMCLLIPAALAMRLTMRAAACRSRSPPSLPYQSPMEDGMQHFHEFYRREMADQFIEPADGRTPGDLRS